MLELSYDAHLVYFLCAWYFLIFSYKTYYLLKKMFFELKCIMCVAHDCIFCQFKQRKANKRISLGFSQSFSFKKTKKNWGRPKLEEQEVNLILTQSSRGSIAFDLFFYLSTLVFFLLVQSLPFFPGLFCIRVLWFKSLRCAWWRWFWTLNENTFTWVTIFFLWQ